MFSFWKSYGPLEKKDPRLIESFNSKLKNGTYQLIETDCVVCNSKDREILFANDRNHADCQTVICRQCGLVYTSPRFDEASNQKFYSSDEYRVIYGDQDLLDDPTKRMELYANVSKPQTAGQHYPRLYFDFITTVYPAPKRVAEIGAGSGWKLVPFMKMGVACIGYEYSEGLTKKGRELGIDLRPPPIGDERFDLIMLNHSLEHFLDPIAGLKELKPNLEDNGYLFIEVPGFEKQVPSLQNAHTFYFSTVTLEYVLALAGFTAIKTLVNDETDFILVMAKKNDANKPNISLVEYRRIKNMVRRYKIKWLFDSKAPSWLRRARAAMKGRPKE